MLGAILESPLRRSLILFEGDPTGFVTRPISATLTVLMLVVLTVPLTTLIRRLVPRSDLEKVHQKENV